jgi:mRNA interferase HigB
MHIITRKRLNEFAEKYPEAKNALAHWYDLAKHNDFSNFPELKQMFGSADQAGKFTIFNIGGNKIR